MKTEDKPFDEFVNNLDNEMIEEYKIEGKLHPYFFPFPTYDLVQCGYPTPNHGEMIVRNHGGTDAQDILLPSKGEYCKVEDIKSILSNCQYLNRWRNVNQEMPEEDEKLTKETKINALHPQKLKSGIIKTKAVIVRYNDGGIALAHRCKCSTDDYYWWDCNESFHSTHPNYIVEWKPVEA